MPKDYYDEETESYKSDCLYFVQEGGPTGYIKIGRTSDVKGRMRRLQTGNSNTLSLLHYAENAGWQEAFWHRAFIYDQERGEWFAPGNGLRRAIKLFKAGKPWFSCARQCPLDDYDPVEWAEHLHDAFEAYEELIFGYEARHQHAAYWTIEDPDFDGQCITSIAFGSPVRLVEIESRPV